MATAAVALGFVALSACSITVHRPSGPTTTLTTRRDGTFAVALPLGSYRITGRSRAFDGGQLDCLTTTTTIAVSTTAPQHIEVICSEK